MGARELGLEALAQTGDESVLEQRPESLVFEERAHSWKGAQHDNLLCSWPATASSPSSPGTSRTKATARGKAGTAVPGRSAFLDRRGSPDPDRAVRTAA